METVLMKASESTGAHSASVDVCSGGLMIPSFQRQSCLLVAHLHGLLGPCALMLLFQVKNCVKLAAQEMKTFLNSYQTTYRDETCRNICPNTKTQAVLPEDTKQTLNQRP